MKPDETRRPEPPLSNWSKRLVMLATPLTVAARADEEAGFLFVFSTVIGAAVSGLIQAAVRERVDLIETAVSGEIFGTLIFMDSFIVRTLTSGPNKPDTNPFFALALLGTAALNIGIIRHLWNTNTTHESN